MKNKNIVHFLAALFAVSVAGATVAAPVAVSSYDMPNGNTGTYNYWDDSYSGAGSLMIDGSPLSGGKGDLTDGIIASDNWSITEAPRGPGPYVGWTSDPTIRFHFGGTVNIRTIRFSFDDSNGSGGVSAPSGVVIAGITYTVADPSGSAPFQFDVSGLNLNVADLDVTLRRANAWVFASEIAFDGDAGVLPEPGALALFGLALTGLACTRRQACRQN